MTTVRIVLTLLAGIAVAGLGAIYVWGTINLALSGTITWARAGAGLVVLAVLLGLLVVLTTLVRHHEEPK